MGEVVKFVSRTDRARRATPVAGSMPACQIIILPCVRYERWTEDMSKPTPQKKKKQAKRRQRSQAARA